MAAAFLVVSSSGVGTRWLHHDLPCADTCRSHRALPAEGFRDVRNRCLRGGGHASTMGTVNFSLSQRDE